MSNILFTRDFNSDTLGETPSDAVAYGHTPNTTPWQVVASGPNSTYAQSLRVLQSIWTGEDGQGELGLLKFAAVDPADTDNSECLILFKGAVCDDRLGFHAGLQLQYGGDPLFSWYDIFAMMDNILEFPAFRGIESWDATNGKGISYQGQNYEDYLDTISTTWYLIRFQAHYSAEWPPGSNLKGKIWEYGTEEPGSWMFQCMGAHDTNVAEPGVSFGIEGAGQIDIAYFSVGYGVGNAPQMPESGGGSQSLDRTCISGLSFSIGNSQSISQAGPQSLDRTCISGFAFTAEATKPRAPISLDRSCISSFSLHDSTRIWKPYGLAHLSFNAMSKVFTFNATSKRFIYSAKAGREQ